MLRSGLILTALLWASAAALAQEPREAPRPSPALCRIEPQTPEVLRKLLNHSPERLPIVSAHRGGPRPGFPENCLATFQHTLEHTFALLEIDPRYAKDGTIVIHHDAELDRTTTGAGRVMDHTLDQLRKFRLKDNGGQVTEFMIPTLDEVLQWARGKTVVVLDQKDVPVAARVKKIEEHKAESYAMLIVYSFADAKACYALNPQIMMEVMIPSHEKLAEFDQAGVPWANVVAFLGHSPPEDPALYEAVHRKGVRCIVGSSRNLDREFARGEAGDRQRLELQYRELLRRGADLIETDIPADLGPLLYGAAPRLGPWAGVLDVK